MTRDEIEEFSGVELNCFETDREEDWYKIGCMDGLEAADAEPDLSSLWHDASEEPIMGARVLINHHLIVITWHNEYKWDACCKLFGITKWAYIDDLLPKQFGNSEQLKGGEK